MPDLRETLDRLVVSFAEDVLDAIRGMSLDEVMGVAAATRDRRAVPAAPATVQRKKAAKKPKSSKQPAVVRADARASEVAERFFLECGKRGATEFQMREAFKAHGLAPGGSPEVVRTLIEREIIRDAGFKRSTRNGIAPVFVLSSLSQ